MKSELLGPWSDAETIRREGGGKAANLRLLELSGHRVPTWICVPAPAFDEFRIVCGVDGIDLSAANDDELSAEVGARFMSRQIGEELRSSLRSALNKAGIADCEVAVRSSGIGEDSAEHSFAGQFDSFLYLRGEESILDALRRCWASAYAPRNLAYRRMARLADPVRMGVVIQTMVQSESAGVAFSRDPLHPADRSTIIVESVWGQGEGLVSGAVDADHFEVERETLCLAASRIARKTHAIVRASGSGTQSIELDEQKTAAPSLDEQQVSEVAALALALEREWGAPQDIEWAYEGRVLNCLQTRPITTLPPDAVFNPGINGDEPVIWDNSNIVESFAGVTTPLTFTHVNRCYSEVYYQFCRLMGVPEQVIQNHESMFRNMLGLIRGRIYYNLLNWYRLLSLLPGLDRSSGFMETMMGVKQSLTPELLAVLETQLRAPRYSFFQRIALQTRVVYHIARTRRYIDDFMSRIERIRTPLEKQDLRLLSLPQQLALYRMLEEEVLKHWTAPIVNDTRCMVAFGMLKSLTSKWVEQRRPDATAVQGSLQNDLLCGEGDLLSTDPTRMLMRIAKAVDVAPADVRDRFMCEDPTELWISLNNGFAPDIRAMFADFLDKYGFRCADELKLEEPDLHEDPGFALASVQSYVRMEMYASDAMESREADIRGTAERSVRSTLGVGPRRWIFFRVLRWATRAVSDRELLRFERTRIFGLTRRLFRAIGANLVQLGVLADEHDVFYLTLDDLVSYIEGRSVTTDFRELAAMRRAEFDEYRRTASPPDRFLTRGTVGSFSRSASLLLDTDLLKESNDGEDSDVLHGTPCSPGIVEGPVRVALRFEDAAGMNGEILVTERTDPGWVPLFPTCAGLIIERGSLLSHSAVVARELGLPTIVGVGGKPTQRLQTGQRIRMDAGKGEIRLL
jgi:rifampicin phosphotransferase